ncbi:MAG TPA: MBL fold metallo-hydrolase [Rhodocyclaceae bacterium]|nr:MBL fold metallo-hydrolase [Rhodocyclaceae bacterium]
MALEFPHLLPPPSGTTVEVAPGVLWLRMPLPFQLDHINLWALRDGDGWTLVDTGFADEGTRSAWVAVLAGLAGPVRNLLVTHFHPDHLGLATWLLEQTGAQLWMTAAEFLTAHAVWHEVGGHGARFMTEQSRQHGFSAELLDRFARRGSGYTRSVPALPERYNRLQAGDSRAIGGREWKVVIGHGHSPEHAALYCQELAVLISGDMLLPRISTNISVMAVTPAADALGSYLASLDAMAREIPDSTLVLPSHGLPFVGLSERIAALHAHHGERLQAVEDDCEAPKSAAELLATLFPRPLDTHQTMFAMGEAIAHLNHLEIAGRLSRTLGGDGVIRFARAAQARLEN